MAVSLLSVMPPMKFGRRGEGVVGELARREAGVVDARQAAIIGVGEVAPARRQGRAGELARGDLPGLAEIGQGERAEVAGMRRQPADRIVGEGLGPGARHGTRFEPTQLVVGRGDGAAGERAAFLLQLQRPQRAHRHVAVLGRAGAVGHRREPREERIVGEADIGRGVDRRRIGDAERQVVLGVAEGLDLAQGVGDRLQPAGGGLVGVGDRLGVGILLGREPALDVVAPAREVALGVAEAGQPAVAVVAERRLLARRIGGRGLAAVGVVGVFP